MKSIVAVAVILSLFLNSLTAQEFPFRELKKRLVGKKIERMDACEKMYNIS